MTIPNTQPLAALLASHPEECAAVVAVLCAEGYDGSTAQGCVEDMHVYRSTPFDLAMAESVLAALAGASLAHRYNKTNWRLSWSPHRYAIARMGAAAWLRERCGAAVANETTADGEGEQR